MRTVSEQRSPFPDSLPAELVSPTLQDAMIHHMAAGEKSRRLNLKLLLAVLAVALGLGLYAVLHDPVDYEKMHREYHEGE